MKVKRFKIGISLALVFILGMLLVSACIFAEPYMPPLQIENQTDMALTIYIFEREVGYVESNKSIEIEKVVSGATSQFLIEAKDRKGEVVFSKEFFQSELYKADWKVVIPPPLKNR